MSNKLSLLVSPGGVALSVSPGGVDFFYAPGSNDAGTFSTAKKRWIVEKNGRLEVYGTASAAIKAASESEKNHDVNESKDDLETQDSAPEASIYFSNEPESKPSFVVDFSQIESFSRKYNEAAAFEKAMELRHYEALLSLFERLQDEDDVEVILAFS